MEEHHAHEGENELGMAVKMSSLTNLELTFNQL